MPTVNRTRGNGEGPRPSDHGGGDRLARAFAAGTVTQRMALPATTLRPGGRIALQQLALDLIGDGSSPLAPPVPPTDPDRPPRPLPPTLPDNIWEIVRKADRVNVAHGDEFWVVPLPELPEAARQLPTLAWCDSALTPVP